MGRSFNVVLVLGIFIGSISAHARDLQGRLGLGYNGQMSSSREATPALPGVSVKYGLTRSLAVEGILAFASGGNDGSSKGVGAKLYKNIFYENYLNFYSFALLGLVGIAGQSGYDFQGGLGVEFFIPGIESIGLSFEAGAELTQIRGKTILRTIGFSFLEAGMRFYF